MSTLPLNIDMRGKTAVIVGGGKVALRKLQALSAAGVASRLVAQEVCPEIAKLAAAGSISVRIGRYGAEDLDHAFLVVAATDDAAVNLSVASDAMERGLLVSVVDNPLAGNFTFPAVLRRGALEIAVSTGGRCPTLAADVRDLIADVIGEEYGAVLEQLAAEREKLLTDGNHSTYNTQVLRSLAGRLMVELTE
ncbi:MAG: bifunctional precorrin-2 dehydrogenase/sirohydrochlorin ferrochelatase, partial [Steroidobacteraceae bacterium]|nr:bifunctional precorrin-2 dehydrogenase/sirohydrochlorin ferrochelatase [Deltaproteobacteria bacterium]